ncbi:MAG: hypothetical protein D6711_17775 [Chloroflexi bacterium]|nr:MAG: hypothetical protein D6711_17775 [Chloroflexota bacterium]
MSPEEQTPPDEETPASVIWMEMMRREAAKRQPTLPVMTETSQQSEPLERLETPPPQVDPDPLPTVDEAALEVQRQRRLERRRKKRRQKRGSILSGIVFSWLIVIISAGLIATILSWSTSPESLSDSLRAQLGQGGSSSQGVSMVLAMTEQPTLTPVVTPNHLIRIGILAGHSGPENDPGAVCPDGLTEAEINFAVAERVWRYLLDRGYDVDLLEEYDSRLADYRADLLVSIHANDCRDYGEYVSGYLVSQHDMRPDDGADGRLMACMVRHYGEASGLSYRPQGVTPDMLEYHVFNRININTPAVIVELGFMKDDREVLTTQPDRLAEGIINGIMCFLYPSLEGEAE